MLSFSCRELTKQGRKLSVKKLLLIALAVTCLLSGCGVHVEPGETETPSTEKNGPSREELLRVMALSVSDGGLPTDRDAVFSRFADLASAGITAVRVDTSWNTSEKGRWEMTETTKNYLDAAKSAGSKVPMASFYHTCRKITQTPRTQNREKIWRIIYVGNMGAFYALDTVITAIKNLESKKIHIRLDLVGTGPDEMRLRKMAQDSKSIHFHGFLNAQELSGELSLANIGIIPMHTESAVAVPYKLPDYTSYGLPVLNSLKGECASLIRQYNAGITYDANSPKSLEEAILRLINNPSLYSELQNGAANLARIEFLAEKIYPAFANFILK